MLSHQVAEPAAERETADARVADDPARRGETVRRAGAIDVRPQRAAGHPRDLALAIDPDRPHQREVDHQAAVADRVPGDRVATATDRDEQLVLAGEPHRLGDVVGAGAAGDQRRATIDRPVPDPAGIVVALFTRAQESAAKARPKPIELSSLDGPRRLDLIH